MTAHMKASDGILIVGGSLCGMTLALACAKRGIPTRILERGIGPSGRGAALGIDRSLLMRVIGADKDGERKIADFPVVTPHRKAVSWQAVYAWLRERALERTEITLIDGVTISEVIQDEYSATAATEDGQRIKRLPSWGPMAIAAWFDGQLIQGVPPPRTRAICCGGDWSAKLIWHPWPVRRRTMMACLWCTSRVAAWSRIRWRIWTVHSNPVGV